LLIEAEFKIISVPP